MIKRCVKLMISVLCSLLVNQPALSQTREINWRRLERYTNNEALNDPEVKSSLSKIMSPADIKLLTKFTDNSNYGNDGRVYYVKGSQTHYNGTNNAGFILSINGARVQAYILNDGKTLTLYGVESEADLDLVLKKEVEELREDFPWLSDIKSKIASIQSKPSKQNLKSATLPNDGNKVRTNDHPLSYPDNSVWFARALDLSMKIPQLAFAEWCLKHNKVNVKGMSSPVTPGTVAYWRDEVKQMVDRFPDGYLNRKWYKELRPSALSLRADMFRQGAITWEELPIDTFSKQVELTTSSLIDRSSLK